MPAEAIPPKEEQPVVAHSDVELTAAIRSGAGDGSELTELYHRHHRAVLAYAGTCSRDPHTAEDLAADAFARTIQAVRSGRGPEGVWRPYLLSVVRRTAADWARTARRTELSPDFTGWLAEASTVANGEEHLLSREDNDLVLRGFRSLPERWQAVLWHTVVEEEPAAQVGAMLGISANAVSSLAARAREGLREAYLTAHAQNDSTGEECRHYSALLGATVRRTGRRSSRHLDRHLAECPRCHDALLDLTELNQRLRSVLPGVVLLWGGSAYPAALRSGAKGAAGAPPPAPTGSGSLPARAPAMPLGAAAAAVMVVVTVGLGGFALLPDVGVKPSAPPPATAAAAHSISSSPSIAPARSTSDHTSSPTATRVWTPKAVWKPKAEYRTRLRIVSTGKCMEIPGGTHRAGAQPREAGCDGGRQQQWDLLLISEGGGAVQLRNAATGLCLSNSGTTTDGAPVKQSGCDHAETAQLWQLACATQGQVAFTDQTGMYLGLDDWRNAAEGRPHRISIGTTHNYSASPSLHFRYDGATLFGR